MTESLLLSGAGGAAGLALAWWGTRYVMVLARTRFPRAQEIGIDWRVFLFLFSISALIGLGLGLMPALTFGRRDPQRALQASGTHSTMGAGSRRLRDALVVAEVALAFVLAVGAALLIRELVRLRATSRRRDHQRGHLSHREPGEIDERWTSVLRNCRQGRHAPQGSVPPDSHSCCRCKTGAGRATPATFTCPEFQGLPQEWFSGLSQLHEFASRGLAGHEPAAVKILDQLPHLLAVRDSDRRDLLPQEHPQILCLAHLPHRFEHLFWPQ